MAIKDTILIVDDNNFVAAAREDQAKFAGTGHKTRIANNLEDAKRILAKGNIAAVITDNDFYAKHNDGAPAKNAGIELVEYIRAIEPKLPILWNSATFDQTIVDRLSKAAGIVSSRIKRGSTLVDIDPHTKALDKGAGPDLDIVVGFLRAQLGTAPSESTSPPGGGMAR